MRRGRTHETTHAAHLLVQLTVATRVEMSTTLHPRHHR
jgi:hypothetical protein